MNERATRSVIGEVTVVHPDLALAPTIDAVSDLSIRLESQPLSDPDSPILFYSVSGSDLRGFESSLETDHTVRDWGVAVDADDCRVYRIGLESRVKVLSPKIADVGVRVLSATNADRGWRLRLHAPEKGDFGAFWDYCRTEGVRFEIEKLYGADDGLARPDDRSAVGTLTTRQREVARTATRMGYYESDGASAEEVAAELDISPSTLSTHLRRCTAKVFRHLFRE